MFEVFKSGSPLFDFLIFDIELIRNSFVFSCEKNNLVFEFLVFLLETSKSVFVLLDVSSSLTIEFHIFVSPAFDFIGSLSQSIVESFVFGSDQDQFVFKFSILDFEGSNSGTVFREFSVSIAFEFRKSLFVKIDFLLFFVENEGVTFFPVLDFDSKSFNFGN